MEITTLVHAANRALDTIRHANEGSLNSGTASKGLSPQNRPDRPELVLGEEDPASFGIVSLLSILASLALLLHPFVVPSSEIADILYLVIGLLCFILVGYMYQDLFFSGFPRRLRSVKKSVLNKSSWVIHYITLANLSLIKRIIQCRPLINSGSSRLKAEWDCDLSMMTVGDLINIMRADPTRFDHNRCNQ